jgi:hypothetical protein
MPFQVHQLFATVRITHANVCVDRTQRALRGACVQRTVLTSDVYLNYITRSIMICTPHQILFG